MADLGQLTDMRQFLLPALLLALGTAWLPFATSVEGASPVTAVFPPWWPQAAVLAATADSGRIVGFSMLPFVVSFADEGAVLDRELRGAGAVLVFRLRLPFTCLSGVSS